jgi:hypothetical protein
MPALTGNDLGSGVAKVGRKVQESVVASAALRVPRRKSLKPCCARAGIACE